MSTLLDDAIAKARALPPDEQDRIAAVVFDALAQADGDAKWEALLARPAPPGILDMAKRARADYRAGRCTPWPEADGE